MSDYSTTKVIGARVGIKDYIRFQKEASESGMTLADWALLKIFFDADDFIKESERQKLAIEKASKEIAELKKQLSAKPKEVTKTVADPDQEKKYKSLMEACAQLQTKYDSLDEKFDSLEDKNELLQTENDKLKKDNSSIISRLQRANEYISKNSLFGSTQF